MSARRHSAFTVVELLVVIAIIGILAAILLPAINAAREAARRANCERNLGQCARAVITYATDKGQLPPSCTANQTLNMVLNWPYAVLPQLEQDTIHKQIMTGSIPTELPRMEVLICPSQIRFDIETIAAGSNLRTTALSYIVNGGRLNKVADNSDFVANGVFVDKGAVRLPTQPPYPKYRIADVSKGDGASNTLMLSETLNAQSYLVAQSPPPSLAASPPEQVLQQRSQMLWFPEDSNTFPNFIGLNQDKKASSTTVDANPRYARPSSMHSGGINVAMCDESVHFFAETVDYRVYAVLMTSHGIKANDPNSPVPANQLPEPDWQDPTHANYPGTKFK